MPTNYIVPTSTSFRLAGLNPAIKPADLGLEFMGETAFTAFKVVVAQSYKRMRPYRNWNSVFGVAPQYLGGQNAVSAVLQPIFAVVQLAVTTLYKILWTTTAANWKRYTQWLGEKILTLQSAAGGSVNTIKLAILKNFF